MVNSHTRVDGPEMSSDAAGDAFPGRATTHLVACSTT
jgi:hypothetical protein